MGIGTAICYATELKRMKGLEPKISIQGDRQDPERHIITSEMSNIEGYESLGRGQG